MKTLLAITLALGAGLALSAQNPPTPPPQQQPQGEVRLTIVGAPGLPPKFAVPDFLAGGGDSATGKLVGQVLWDDLNFEREFYLVPRDTYGSIPQPASLDQVPLDRWKELGVDGLVVGSVRRSGTNIVVQVRVIEVASGRSVFAKEYSGAVRTRGSSPTPSPTRFTSSSAALRGVARTKLAFTSDRDGERVKGAANARDIQNIYIADYDGANQRRITATPSLDITPAWSPDTNAMAYTSYRSGFPDILVADLTGRRALAKPANGSPEKQNFLPAWSPDGSRSWRSCRTATATPRSTSSTATAARCAV